MLILTIPPGMNAAFGHAEIEGVSQTRERGCARSRPLQPGLASLVYYFRISVSCITRRRASLTALASEKTFATSGSSKTKLVPLRNLSTYLPRTPVLSSFLKSYSGRSSSFLLVRFFFIVASLSRCESPSTDNSHTPSAVGICAWHRLHDCD